MMTSLIHSQKDANGSGCETNPSVRLNRGFVSDRVFRSQIKTLGRLSASSRSNLSALTFKLYPSCAAISRKKNQRSNEFIFSSYFVIDSQNSRQDGFDHLPRGFQRRLEATRQQAHSGLHRHGHPKELPRNLPHPGGPHP